MPVRLLGLPAIEAKLASPRLPEEHRAFAREVLTVQRSFIESHMVHFSPLSVEVLPENDKTLSVYLGRSSGSALLGNMPAVNGIQGFYAAASELSSNLMAHGGGGLLISGMEQVGRTGFFSLFSLDTGMGIDDFPLELSRSWDTHNFANAQDNLMSSSSSPGHRIILAQGGFGTVNIVRPADKVLVASRGKTWAKRYNTDDPEKRYWQINFSMVPLPGPSIVTQGTCIRLRWLIKDGNK